MSADALQPEELAQALEMIVADIRTGSLSARTQDDFYWTILEADELYDVTREPATYGIGSLSDDIESVRRLLQERDVPGLGLAMIEKVLPVLSNIYHRVYGEPV
ncbi:hypothetical protein [Deinococcus gobiensis]|uniref:Uncharacterized protein n=1 Tax=Deinococcus gobiensis (strain DSM 21396 / JCM 16679 / CGMCC 1.7299 / I-0) TaxID=745776 RepID=H8GTX5_DEIGI|nr:hypothetical protein [Deinococcus gobiensis]AFD26615.1 hypothetical protein DGo_CA2688 [Deinococcus gobiensis I-0]